MIKKKFVIITFACAFIFLIFVQLYKNLFQYDPTELTKYKINLDNPDIEINFLGHYYFFFNKINFFAQKKNKLFLSSVYSEIEKKKIIKIHYLIPKKTSLTLELLNQKIGVHFLFQNKIHHFNDKDYKIITLTNDSNFSLPLNIILRSNKFILKKKQINLNDFFKIHIDKKINYKKTTKNIVVSPISSKYPILEFFYLIPLIIIWIYLSKKKIIKYNFNKLYLKTFKIIILSTPFVIFLFIAEEGLNNNLYNVLILNFLYLFTGVITYYNFAQIIEKKIFFQEFIFISTLLLAFLCIFFGDQMIKIFFNIFLICLFIIFIKKKLKKLFYSFKKIRQ